MLDPLIQNTQCFTKNIYYFGLAILCYFDYSQRHNRINSIQSQTNISGNNVLHLPLRCLILHLKQEANFV